MASAALTGASRWSADHNHPLTTGVLLIAALALSAFLLLGPKLRAGSLITIIALVLFIIQFDAVIIITARGINYAANPAYVLQLIAFGLFGFAALLCIGVTWLSGWPFSEPLAIGAASLALAGLCLPGLAGFTRTISYPSAASGAAMLYSDAAPGQSLALEVDYQNGFNGTPQVESFSIDNLAGRRSVRWALIVNGTASLRNIKLYAPDIRYRLLVKNAYTSVQMFAGIVGKGTFESISATISGTFANYTSDEAAVSLPSYVGGYGGMLSGSERGLVIGFLHRNPTLSTVSNLTISVTAGPHLPFESLTDSSPPPVHSSEPGTFEWVSRGLPLQVRYAVTLGNAASSTNAALFAFSVLLGVAGAGVLASLQGTIRAFARRRPAG